MYRPGSSSQASVTFSSTESLVVTSDVDLTATGNFELQTTVPIALSNINDITRAVEQNQLVIRRHDTGSTTDYVTTYPTINFGDSTDTITYASNAVTFDTIELTNQGGHVSFQYSRPPRRGRVGVRRNHRGLLPRAVSVDFSQATPAEIQALQLLRGLVGQDEFRRYLKYGFVMVRGASGLRYQVRRGRHVVDVWNERGRVDGICVYLGGPFPPTDDTITRMLMAERDELELWRRGNSRLGKGATLQDLQRLYGQRKVA